MAFVFYFIAAVIALLSLGNLFTWGLQEFFIFWPQKLDPAHRYTFNAPFREIMLPTSHGGRINGLWFQQPEHQSQRGIVLYFHGNTGNLTRWGNLHHFFARHGYDFFTYDYRGFGKSRGPHSEKLFHDDARQLYQYIRRFYSPEQIVLFGRSLGSAFAGRLAAEYPAKMLILETPFSSMPDLFHSYYPYLPRLFRFKYQLSNRRVLPQVRCPVYIFHGTDDIIVPLECAARLKPALKSGDRFFTIPMGRHNDLMMYEAYQHKMESVLAGKG